MAQSVKRPTLPTLGFSSGHDFTTREFEPHVGLCADAQSLEPASDCVSPSLSAPPPLMRARESLSLKKK